MSYNKTNIWSELSHRYQYGGSHTKLIFINVGFFIAFNLLLIFDKLFLNGLGSSFIWSLVQGSSDVSNLLIRPWTAVTNIFMHAGIMHLLFNMIFLYVFGNIVRDLVGDSKIVPIFILSALFGFILFLAAYNLVPFYKSLGTSRIIGASGGVMGIVFAAIALAPDYSIRLLFLGYVKIKWIGLFYALIDIMSLQGGNAGGSIAHLGGAIVGFYFIRNLQEGRDWGKPFYWVEDFIAKRKQPKPKIKVVYKQEEKVKTEAYQRQSQRSGKQANQHILSKQERLDEILDKINRSGYDSLNEEEKAFLFKISQEDS